MASYKASAASSKDKTAKSAVKKVTLGVREIFIRMQKVLCQNLNAVRTDPRITLEELFKMNSVHKEANGANLQEPHELFRSYMSTAIDIAVPYDEYGKQIMEQFDLTSDQLYQVVANAKEIGKDVSHKLRESVMFLYDPLEPASSQLNDWLTETFK